LLTLIEQTALDLFERQIGLPPNQLKQSVLVFLRRRSALAPDRSGLKTPGFPPALHPADRGRIPNHKLPRRRPCRRSNTPLQPPQLGEGRRILFAFLLPDGCTIRHVAAGGDILDPYGDEITAAHLAADRQIEHGEVARAVFDLELRPD
jgi:hypothetical protein